MPRDRSGEQFALRLIRLLLMIAVALLASLALAHDAFAEVGSDIAFMVAVISAPIIPTLVILLSGTETMSTVTIQRYRDAVRDHARLCIGIVKTAISTILVIALAAICDWPDTVTILGTSSSLPLGTMLNAAIITLVLLFFSQILRVVPSLRRLTDIRIEAIRDRIEELDPGLI